MKKREALFFRLPATWSKAECQEFLKRLDQARAAAGERYLNDFVFAVLKREVEKIERKG